MERKYEHRVYPLGSSALTFDFGNVISEELNEFVVALSGLFESNPFPGFIECVPAYSALTVFYDSALAKSLVMSSETIFEAVSRDVESRIPAVRGAIQTESEVYEIPVDFSSENGPDLETVAELNGISTEEVIDLFLARKYRVYMLGFLPGFAYMGTIDPRISAPRLSTPRTKVPKGSVGIAGLQTGVYPMDSPGGWQVIGRTDTEMFLPDLEHPSYLSAGDLVQFVRKQ